MRFLHSHSAHGAFDDCPKKFELLQTGAPRRSDAPNFLFGRTFHRFAELYRNHCIEARRWSDIEVVGELLDQAFRDTGLSTQHYEELQLLCRYFVANEKIDIDRSLMREGGIAFDENFKPLPWSSDFDYDSPTFKASGSRAAIRMKLDETLVDPVETLLIIDDWKSDYYVPSQSEIEDPSARWWKQATEYAWGAARVLYPSASGVLVRFKFVRWNIKREIYLSRDDVNRYGEIFLRKIQFIEATEQFAARPGNHCRTCPFLNHGCPLEESESFSFDEYETEVEATAARFLYDAAVQESRREVLKAHADANGMIVVGGLPVAIFEKSERKILDIQRVLDAMTAEGIEHPELMLDATPSKLERVLDADQVERVIAAGTAEHEATVVFSVHQNKPELVALAESLGIVDAKKMKVAQLAQAIARVGGKREAA